MTGFVGIDWGTSNARFLLADGNGALQAQRRGPGIGRLAGPEQIEQACFAAIGGWLAADPALPVVMTGMVGSNIGWHGAGYVPAPAAFADLAGDLLHFTARGHRFTIVPGLSTCRSDGLPDRMRGEETQVFGAAARPDGLYCLPGTHSKWVVCSAGRIGAFHTALTGELLDLLGRHSVLLDPRGPVRASDGEGFRDGVQTARDSALGLETLVFGVRARQLAGTLAAAQADSYLAGLAIGCEIRSALALHGAVRRLTLIGSPGLAALYAAALGAFGIESTQIDGDTASLAGQYRIRQEMRG